MEPKTSFGQAPAEQDKRAIRPGRLEDMLADACRQCETTPEELLNFRVSREQVVIILPTGQKVKFDVEEEREPQRAQRTRREERERGAGAPMLEEKVVTESDAGGAAADTNEIPLSEAGETMHKIAGRASRRKKAG